MLRTLGIPGHDEVLYGRVKTFIACNGYESLRAAHYAALRAAKESITDPWAYAIRVYNGNLARLSYLYVLIHWVESGLRSQVNLHYMEAAGPVWHRHPERYLPAPSVAEFLAVHAHGEIDAAYVRPSDTTRQVIQPDEPAAFLQRVTFGWLARMALYAHKNHPTHILVPRAGQSRLMSSRAETLLDSAKDVRNAIARNRYLSNERFTRHHADLIALLDVLRFDVAKALSRSESVRSRLIQRQIAALGTPSAPP